MSSLLCLQREGEVAGDSPCLYLVAPKIHALRREKAREAEAERGGVPGVGVGPAASMA